jgi:hypothetical protein
MPPGALHQYGCGKDDTLINVRAVVLLSPEELAAMTNGGSESDTQHGGWPSKR